MNRVADRYRVLVSERGFEFDAAQAKLVRQAQTRSPTS